MDFIEWLGEVFSRQKYTYKISMYAVQLYMYSTDGYLITRGFAFLPVQILVHLRKWKKGGVGWCTVKS